MLSISFEHYFFWYFWFIKNDMYLFCGDIKHNYYLCFNTFSFRIITVFLAQCQIKTKKILKRLKEALKIIAGYKSGTKCFQRNENLSGLQPLRMKQLNIVNFYTYPNPVNTLITKNCFLVEPTVF